MPKCPLRNCENEVVLDYCLDCEERMTLLKFGFAHALRSRRPDRAYATLEALCAEYRDPPYQYRELLCDRLEALEKEPRRFTSLGGCYEETPDLAFENRNPYYAKKSS